MAQEIERRIGNQEVATTTWKVADRRGVFVDYGQNARDRTVASAYSIRPTPDARASAPLDWAEVRTVRPERFTLTTMRKRIDEVGDLTKGMWRYKRSLSPLFSKLDLEPADPTKLDSGRRRASAQRWESGQGRNRNVRQPRRASR
jgi:DNA primase